MLFGFKSAVLAGLLATSFASPIAQPALEARAVVPASVNCDGTTFTDVQIKDAIKESRTQHGTYPKAFGNKSGTSTVFASTAKNMYEQPIASPTWKGGAPGRFRVVVNEKYVYVGTMYHTAGLSNNFKACVAKKA